MYKAINYEKMNIFISAFVSILILFSLTSCSLYNEIRENPLVFVAKVPDSSQTSVSSLSKKFNDIMNNEAVKNIADKMNKSLSADAKESNIFIESDFVIVDMIVLKDNVSSTDDKRYHNIIYDNIGLIKEFINAVKNKMGNDDIKIIIIYTNPDSSFVYQETVR